MSKDWIIRHSNNVYGEKMKDCFAGSYNVTLEDTQPILNIYLYDELLISIPAFKNPYHLAKAILGVSDPEVIVNQIKLLITKGYVPGVDFTITEKGVNLRSHIKEVI